MVTRPLSVLVATAFVLSSLSHVRTSDAGEAAGQYFGHIETACSDTATCEALKMKLKNIDTVCTKIGEECAPAKEFLNKIFGGTYRPSLPDYLVYLEQQGGVLSVT